jgi:competence ComEA-like helix-hairpin-helix protein
LEPLRTGTLVTVARTSDGNLRIHAGRMEARKLLVFFIPLDLNRASVEDLCLIPGVGESLARDIVAYREKRKGFRTVGELRQVKGIGETKWEALRDHLTVR